MEKREMEYDEGLYNQFFALVGSPDEGKSVSQAQAAREIGYSSGVVSACKSLTYNGNVKEVEAAIQAWLKRRERRLGRLEVPIVDTDNHKSIFHALNVTQDERSIAVIVGNAGLGKTVSCDVFERDSHSTIRLDGMSIGSKKDLLEGLAEAVGVDGKGRASVVGRRVSGALRERDALVIIDEADYLPDACLDLVRHVINDEGETGVALVGLPRLEYKLKNLRNDHQQITSRVGVFLKVKPLTRGDVEKILEGVWKGLPKETTEAFAKAANGSARVLTKVMRAVHGTLALNHLEQPDGEVIAEAGKILMR